MLRQDVPGSDRGSQVYATFLGFPPRSTRCRSFVRNQLEFIDLRVCVSLSRSSAKTILHPLNNRSEVFTLGSPFKCGWANFIELILVQIKYNGIVPSRTHVSVV